MRGILNTHTKMLDLYDGDEEESATEANVTVLDRLRAPAPPEKAALLARSESSR